MSYDDYDYEGIFNNDPSPKFLNLIGEVRQLRRKVAALNEQWEAVTAPIGEWIRTRDYLGIDSTKFHRILADEKAWEDEHGDEWDSAKKELERKLSEANGQVLSDILVMGFYREYISLLSDASEDGIISPAQFDQLVARYKLKNSSFEGQETAQVVLQEIKAEREIARLKREAALEIARQEEAEREKARIEHEAEMRKALSVKCPARICRAAIGNECSNVIAHPSRIRLYLRSGEGELNGTRKV